MKNTNNHLKENTKFSKKMKEHWPTWAVIGAGVITLSLVISLGGKKKDSQTDDFVY